MAACCCGAIAIVEKPDLSHFVRHLQSGLDHIDLAVDGITCAACMMKIEQGLAALPEITRARVNLTNRRLTVEWKQGTLDPVRVIERISELGYKAYPFDTKNPEDEHEREAAFLLRCLAVAAFAAMNVMLLSVSVWSGNATDITPEQRDFFHMFSALIALPAAAYAGQPFFRSAIRAIMTRNMNMDVPITVGVLLALGMSVFETINHAEHAYFDAALMLLSFLLAGRYLEQNMRRRTRAVATNLAALKAETATKFISDTEISEVPASAINPGDIVLVRPGERLAVDGVVIHGRSEIDQSLVTGETLPLAAETGTNVYAGTLNLSGALRLRVTTTERGTLLDEVARLLDNAAQSRSRYVRLADRAARLYSPVVHAAALATMLGWVALGASWHDAIITAIAVLIITCPCALALAIPAVQVIAAGALFRSGVLLNSGDAIERLAAVDTVVFDKTGTLTLPEPEVTNAADMPPDMLALAGQLALASSHPLAQAVVRASGAKTPLAGAMEEPGQGVRHVVNGTEIRLGRPAFCDATAEAERIAASDPEASIIAFRCGDARHAFAVRQRLRADAAETIARLDRRGFAVEMLSGDRGVAVEATARATGIGAWQAALTPADKIAHIERIKQEGRNVLMVGDGLNDAPALAAASVSLSPVTATHLAQASADAVFLGDRLKPVEASLAIARKAFRLMRENLWLAVIYNLIAVPLAILGYVTPLIAAAAMSGSSILVIANALRAQKVRETP
jgi:Cu2+-exporting ATPase